MRRRLVHQWSKVATGRRIQRGRCTGKEGVRHGGAAREHDTHSTLVRVENAARLPRFVALITRAAGLSEYVVDVVEMFTSILLKIVSAVHDG